MIEGNPTTLGEWIRRAANTIGLTDWAIEYVWDEELPEHVLARVSIPRARQAARIRLGSEFRVSKPEEKRATLIHELMHCHFEPMSEYVSETLPMAIGKPSFHVFETAYDLLAERAIDAIAVAFAEKLPLPPEEE